MADKKRAFSGIQSTGKLTLGNYLGALKQHVSFQDTYDAIFCVVNLHSITVRQDPKELINNTYDCVAWYLASGLDPKKAILFAQSHVRAHAELSWVLSTFTQVGELERMTQYKDKSKQHKQNVNAGLLTYPTLMAADILLYNTDVVPVGDDQKQHIELTRNVAERFNGIYGEKFIVPEHYHPPVAARVKDLAHPDRKMSKSLPGKGCVLLEDDPAAILKKFKKATTDNEDQVRLDAENQPGITNLLEIYAATQGVSSDAALSQFKDSRYGDFKVAVGEAVGASLAPVQDEYKRILADRGFMDSVLKDGSARAAEIADAKIAEIYEAVGFIKRG